MLNISKIWLTDTGVWIRTADPRLLHASAKERANYECSPYGIHWPQIDEDLCFDGFLKQ